MWIDTAKYTINTERTTNERLARELGNLLLNNHASCTGMQRNKQGEVCWIVNDERRLESFLIPCALRPRWSRWDHNKAKREILHKSIGQKDAAPELTERAQILVNAQMQQQAWKKHPYPFALGECPSAMMQILGQRLKTKRAELLQPCPWDVQGRTLWLVADHVSKQVYSVPTIYKRTWGQRYRPAFELLHTQPQEV